MNGNIRWIAFALVGALVLGLVALLAPQAMPGAETAEKREAEARLRAKIIDCTPNPYFEKYRGIGSDWQFLRSGSTGEKVEFNPFTITCNPQNGHRDVWVQITYARSDDKVVEDESTIQTITFNRERIRYRIDCAGRQRAVVERQWMGDAPDDVAHAERVSEQDVALAPLEPGGIADALAGPACSTGRL